MVRCQEVALHVANMAGSAHSCSLDTPSVRDRHQAYVTSHDYRSQPRGHMEHYQETSLRMTDMEDDAHPSEAQEDEDSGASEADLLCSEVLSESHDEGSDVGSDGLYRRRYNHHAAQVSNINKKNDIIFPII